MATYGYTVEDAHVTDTCHDCGEVASVILVALESEKETGYTDEIPLCEECAEKRGV